MTPEQRRIYNRLWMRRYRGPSPEEKVKMRLEFVRLKAAQLIAEYSGDAICKDGDITRKLIYGHSSLNSVDAQHIHNPLSSGFHGYRAAVRSKN